MPASEKSEKEQGASEYQKQKQVVSDLLSSAESACPSRLRPLSSSTRTDVVVRCVLLVPT